MSHKTLLKLLIGFSAIGAGLFLTPWVQAAPSATGFSITVSTTTDEYGAGASCSLREAVETANTDTNFGGCTRVSSGAPPDRIILQASATYTLTRAGADDTNVNGDLDITETVTIVGNASTINGNGATTGDRVIDILSGAGTINISDIKITKGNTVSNGAGIRNDATLNLSNCSVFNNQSLSNAGGGVSNQAGAGRSMTIDDCAVTNNSAATLGGGVDNHSIMTITNSTILANTASGGVSPLGGGVSNSNLATLTISNTTISGNSAVDEGGGIHNSGGKLTVIESTVKTNDASIGGGISSSGPLTITRSTINSNSANSAAGGVRISGTITVNVVNSTLRGNLANGSGGAFFVNSGATVNIHSATLDANEADFDNNASGFGGGINIANGATVTLRNSILLSNSANSGFGHDCAGAIALLSYTFITLGPGCTVTTTVGGPFAAPSLNALADNGGPTLTQSFLDGASDPAINAGDPSGCTDTLGALLATDQRGFGRHLPKRCDLGAFEYPAELFLPFIRR